jgi:hypothetical protein
MSAAEEITRLLEEMREGDPEAAEELLSHIYHEPRALAGSTRVQEAPGQTVQGKTLYEHPSPGPC